MIQVSDTTSNNYQGFTAVKPVFSGHGVSALSALVSYQPGDIFGKETNLEDSCFLRSKTSLVNNE